MFLGCGNSDDFEDSDIQEEEKQSGRLTFSDNSCFWTSDDFYCFRFFSVAVQRDKTATALILVFFWFFLPFLSIYLLILLFFYYLFTSSIYVPKSFVFII